MNIHILRIVNDEGFFLLGTQLSLCARLWAAYVLIPAARNV